jgi:hypothetical protein
MSSTGHNGLNQTNKKGSKVMMRIKHVDKAELLEELWNEVLDASQDLKAIEDEVDAAKDVLRDRKAIRKELEAKFDAVNARYIAVKLDTTKPLRSCQAIHCSTQQERK